MSHPIQSCLAVPHRAASNIVRSLILAAICWLNIQGLAHAQYSILHVFTDATTDGSNPRMSLTQGHDGNLYGTTFDGGTSNSGTVFSISTTGGSFSVLHSFTGIPDGSNPGGVAGGGLVESTTSPGTFFGTTDDNPGSGDNGTVFKMSISGGVGTETILHHFGDGTVPGDGSSPCSGLLLGSDGNLYGITAINGVIYAIAPTTTPPTMSILYTLNPFLSPPDGTEPMGGLVQLNGVFYGTTSSGGQYHDGTIFSLTITGGPSPSTILKTLYNFNYPTVPTDGEYPDAALVVGSDGNLYGTTSFGGNGGTGGDYGTVFKLTPPTGTTGAIFSTIHIFSGTDGAKPVASLIQATDGNFYGTTSEGGTTIAMGGGSGTVFQITPSGGFTTLHNFHDGSVLNDGAEPLTSLIQGTDGALYGTTNSGGGGGSSGDYGTIFRLVPPLSYPTWVMENGLTGSNASPTATLEPDLLTNLLKYSLGLNPATNYNPNDPGLPYTSVQSFSGTNYLTLTFNGVATDVTYEVQASSDLTGAWSTIATYSATAPGTVTVQDSQALTASSKRFMRVLMTYGTTTVASVPEGYFTSNMSAGSGTASATSDISFPMQGIATASGQMVGIVTGITSTTITNSSAGWTAGQLSVAATPYLIQFTSGAAVGRTFLISISTSNTTTTLTIDSTDASLTDLTTLGVVTGSDTYQIIPADTISSVFGTPATTGILGGTSASNADVVGLNNGFAWINYYYNTTTSQWTRSSPAVPSNNVVIRPDWGVLYSRLANTALNLTLTGRVPTVARQSLVSNSGTTFISAYWPADITLVNSNIQNIPGWVTGSSYSVSDQVQLFNGVSWKQYYNNGSHWLLSAPPANSDSVTILGGTASIISKQGSATGTSILYQPVPYSF